jgi:AraC-like DNA-binding protein
MADVAAGHGQDGWAALRRRLQGVLAERRPAARFAPDAPYHAGLETRLPGEGYHWDGRRRGGNPARPYVVLQFALDGWGVYQEDGGPPERVGTGRAFAAVVPGTHRYLLPPDAPGPWTFFWVLVRHPYVAARVAERQRAAGNAVWDVAPGDALVTRAAALFAGHFADRWDEEAALFDLLVAFERTAEAQTSGGAAGAEERGRMLAGARRFVEARLSEPADVSELARAWGMERSRFSHRFKAVTGQSPARFMVRVRLEEAARRLAQSGDTLSAVAAATGFADANHLCKVFRRHYGLSPGAYRGQLRGAGRAAGADS